MASQLGQRERELEVEYQRRRSLMLTILPERVVDDVDVVDGGGDLVDIGTVVAVSVSVDADDASDDLDLGDLRASAAALAESLAAEHAVERIRADADRYLFVAGAGSDESGTDAALAFASGLVTGIAELAAQVQVSVTTRVGVSTGPVALGVFGEHGLMYTAWGEPVRLALVIGGLAVGDEILLDASAREAMTAERWEVSEAKDVVDIDGASMSLWVLTGADASAST
jgi:class 3 adenylate cyclase